MPAGSAAQGSPNAGAGLISRFTNRCRRRWCYRHEAESSRLAQPGRVAPFGRSACTSVTPEVDWPWRQAAPHDPRSCHPGLTGSCVITHGMLTANQQHWVQCWLLTQQPPRWSTGCPGTTPLAGITLHYGAATPAPQDRRRPSAAEPGYADGAHHRDPPPRYLTPRLCAPLPHLERDEASRVRSSGAPDLLRRCCPTRLGNGSRLSRCA